MKAPRAPTRGEIKRAAVNVRTKELTPLGGLGRSNQAQDSTIV